MMLRRSVLSAVAIAVMTAVAAIFVLSACGGGDDGSGECEDVITDPETLNACRGNPENLPGTFVPSQGRAHFNRTHNPDIPPQTPFCDGVATSDTAGAASVEPPAGDFTCYASNPPSSGPHLPSQRNVRVAPGARINIPPDPDVYPPDIEIPREAIPHILEHAGVFVGYNCTEADAACGDVVAQLERVVNDRIDANKRVVMARDSDLPSGTIGIVSWTRIETFAYEDFTEDRVVAFINAHSCRFDPEGFC